MKKITFILGLTYITGLVLLIRSVVLSGHRFQFNGDELFNANVVYLMLKGYKPYVDFYLGYSPIMHWLLSPIFLISGITFETVSLARIVMIVIFFIKTGLLFWLVKRIFGKSVAFLFLPLFLLNPFVVFAEMQIRPDNFMMLFYTLFLLVFSYTYYSRSAILFIISGALFGLTFLTHTKVAPSLLAFGLVFFLFCVKQKSLWRLWHFLNGFALSGLAFFFYFLIKGNVGEMFQQVFLDTFRIYNRYPTWLGYFYFSNPVVYGHDGKPMSWIYSWSLPIMAFAGGYASIFLSNRKRHSGEEPSDDSRIVVSNNDSGQVFRQAQDTELSRSAGMTFERVNLMKIILFVSLVFQWASLLFINSVFMQYYIPLNWLYSLFASYFLYSLIIQIKVVPLLQRGITVILVILLILLLKSSILGNINRSKITDDPIVREMTQYWQMIPEDSPAYPNVIFRKPIYPLLWGQVISDSVRDRYPPAYQAIERHKLKVLTGLTDDFLSYLDVGTQRYILTHYQRDTLDVRLWRRKD